MKRAGVRALLVLLLSLCSAATGWAELVYFANGRTMSVKASRAEGASVVLTLRGGGEAWFDRNLVARIEPDEVPYPELAEVELTEVGVSPSAGEPSPDTGEGDTQSGLSLSRYEPLIQRLSATHGVDPLLVRAVIQVESAYRPGARSPKGAVGLMQVMPATGRQYGITNLWDPASNIEAGVTHLRSLLDRFSVSLALAAYNAGEATVRRFNGVPPYPETRNYVSRVLKLVGR